MASLASSFRCCFRACASPGYTRPRSPVLKTLSSPRLSVPSYSGLKHADQAVNACPARMRVVGLGGKRAPWLGDQSPTATSLPAPKPQEPDDPTAARDPPALVRAAAFNSVQTAPKRCGCSLHLMPDMTGLSDKMVSLPSSPAPGARRGRTSISGANTSTSRCGRVRLIGQEQSWSSVWGEPARAGGALLGAEAPPGARGRSPRFA